MEHKQRKSEGLFTPSESKKGQNEQKDQTNQQISKKTVAFATV